jgi:hypothetical protein
VAVLVTRTRMVGVRTCYVVSHDHHLSHDHVSGRRANARPCPA